MNDYDSLIIFAKSQGWYVEDLSKHRRFVSPTGEVVTAPLTPSDYRSFRNSVAELRRRGLQVPRRRTAPKTRVRPVTSMYKHICEENNVNLDIAPWPFVRSIIGQWRDDSWFDDQGMPITDDEWQSDGFFTEEDLIASTVVIAARPDKIPLSHFWEEAQNTAYVQNRLTQQRPTDKYLMTTLCALKYWGSLSDPDIPMPEKCLCGETPGNLAEHVVNAVQVGRGIHGPEGLREWIDPEEIRLIMQDDDLTTQVKDLESLVSDYKERWRRASEELSALRSKVRAALG